LLWPRGLTFGDSHETDLDITKAFATDEQYRPSVGVPKSHKISTL
jgi:hypothetical protein